MQSFSNIFIQQCWRSAWTRWREGLLEGPLEGSAGFDKDWRWMVWVRGALSWHSGFYKRFPWWQLTSSLVVTEERCSERSSNVECNYFVMQNVWAFHCDIIPLCRITFYKHGKKILLSYYYYIVILNERRSNKNNQLSQGTEVSKQLGYQDDRCKHINKCIIWHLVSLSGTIYKVTLNTVTMTTSIYITSF